MYKLEKDESSTGIRYALKKDDEELYPLYYYKGAFSKFYLNDRCEQIESMVNNKDLCKEGMNNTLKVIKELSTLMYNINEKIHFECK